MFTIRGSGFGLYGYLPALVEAFGEKIILPISTQPKVLARKDLSHLLPDIKWAADEQSALREVNAVVVAVTPDVQEKLVAECLLYPAIEKFVLEKPLAVTPVLAQDILSRLEAAGRRIRVGYTFLYTDWCRKLPWPARSVTGEIIRINWTFMAHHFAHSISTWKRLHSKGGGVIRFYGIHLIAYLVRIGYNDVAYSAVRGKSADEPQQWNAVFRGSGLADCHIYVDSCADTNLFEITQHTASGMNILLAHRDPFQTVTRNGNGDARVPVLIRVLNSFEKEKDAVLNIFYKKVNTLWGKTESITDIS